MHIISETCLRIIVVIGIAREVLTQECNSKNCSSNCKPSLINNNCTNQSTYLNIELNAKEIVITCKKMISDLTDEFRIIPTFDATYLTAIDDKSPLTLASMLKKCYMSKVKNIGYALDYSKLSNIIVTKDILDPNIPVTYLKYERKLDVDEQVLANLTVLQRDFLAHGSHLNTLIINNLKIPTLNNDYFTNLSHIETLDLEANQIEVIEKGIFKNSASLSNINLSNNNISSLAPNTFEGPTNITFLDLSLNNITHLDKTLLANAETVQFLNLSSNNLKTIDSDTFSLFLKLEILDLSNNPGLAPQDKVLATLTSLKSLNLSGCNLTNIPTKFLSKSQYLQVLNLSRNSISNLENDSFHHLTNLKIVDLSFNNLKLLPNSLLNSLNSLQKLFLNFNELTLFDSQLFWGIHELQTIDMSFNLISSFNNQFGRFNANSIILRNNKIDKFPNFLMYSYVGGLRKLDLSYNSISSVELIEELIPKPSDIQVFLSNNQIHRLNVTNLDEGKNTSDNWKVMLGFSGNKLKCNCLRYEIESTQQAHTMVLELTSKGKVCYDEVPHYNCPLVHISNCPQECHCFYTRPDNAIVVDCSYRKLTKFPDIRGLKTNRWKHDRTYINLDHNEMNKNGQEVLKMYDNVTSLDLSYNVIEELLWLPDNFTKLNLDGNHLTGLPQDIVDDLRQNQDLQNLSLCGNPWYCDCKATYLQKYLIEINNIKLKESDVLCHDTLEYMVYKTNLCESQVAIPLSLAALLALFSIVFAVYFKYKMNIKIYLYSKNLCLWCVAEDEIDRDKTYDIFISYSHKDEAFVQKDLLPELETGEVPFKICIHYRDFIPGEFISTQIVNSVLNSRRTLVILSNNFMESVWGKMEFRTAHLQAINEGLARVIVVLYGDLDESVLDDEMKTYLKTNTYVKWGDPWFWNKLKYALPHSTRNDSLASVLANESRDSINLT